MDAFEKRKRGRRREGVVFVLAIGIFVAAEKRRKKLFRVYGYRLKP